MTRFKKVKKIALKDPGTRKAYREMDLEFSIVSQIIEKRIQLGLSQKDLALKIGTKQPSIARFESGTYNPTVVFLQKVSRALGGELKITI